VPFSRVDPPAKSSSSPDGSGVAVGVGVGVGVSVGVGVGSRIWADAAPFGSDVRRSGLISGVRRVIVRAMLMRPMSCVRVGIVLIAVGVAWRCLQCGDAFVPTCLKFVAGEAD